MAPQLSVIINPISGVGGRPGRAAELHDSVSAILSARNVVPRLFVTEGVGHARTIADALVAEGVSTVVAWGGDGTVNEVASALAFSQTRLAIVPLGSGNGLARGLGIPLSAGRALDVALGPHERSIDVGELDGRRFVNVAGIGLDAAIAHRFALEGLVRRGLRRYVEATMREAFAFRAQECVIVADGETIRVEPMLVVLANGREFGNGAVIATSAIVDDGRLDLVIVSSRPALVALLQAPMLFLGRAAHLPGVTIRTVSEVTITAGDAIRYHVDGEPCVGGGSVRARVHRRALRVMVPAQVYPTNR